MIINSMGDKEEDSGKWSGQDYSKSSNKFSEYEYIMFGRVYRIEE